MRGNASLYETTVHGRPKSKIKHLRLKTKFIEARYQKATGLFLE